MCQQCWVENGSPKIVNERTVRAIDLVKKVYEHSITGGNLHIIVDDFNIDDSDIQFCEGAIEENYHKLSADKQQVERECLSAFKQMSMDERASALALYDGYFRPSTR